MQPLDLTFHGPLKTAYNKKCEAYMVNNPGAKITTFDVVGLYTFVESPTTFATLQLIATQKPSIEQRILKKQ